MAGDKTVIISTHILEEVGCGVHAGIIIARGPHRGRRHAAGAGRTLALSQCGVPEPGTARAAGRRPRAVAALPLVADVEMDTTDARLTALPRNGAPLLGALAELAAAQGIALKELHLESGRLDEVFRTITA